MEVLFSFAGMKFFSVYGLAALLLVFIPNLVFARKEHQARMDDIDTCSFWVCFTEMISRLVMIGAAILLRKPLLHFGFVIAAAVVLLLYYAAWIRYYKQGAYYPEIYTERFLGIPIPMTVLSVAYYILISIWLCNPIALCAALIFGACHISNAAVARKDLRCRAYGN